MSESKVNVTSAIDLLLLGESAKDVPPKKIVQAFLKDHCHQESDISLYECLFTNIIHHFEPKEFEQEVSCVVLPKLVIFLKKIEEELQTSGLSYFFVENLTLLLRVADVLQKLLEYVTAQAERCQLYHSLIIFPEYLLRCYTIVRQNYVTMGKEADVLEAMKALYAVCKKILMTFLELLCPRDTDTTRRSYFRLMDHEKEYECLEKVCTLLASVGNEISPIDSLLASDVWKAIVKLCTEHAEQCVTKNRTGWLSQIIVTLNSGIDASFNEIRVKNEPSKQATISLKLNAFFLRVMLKLLSLLKPHTTREVFRPIIVTLLEIKTTLRLSAEVCQALKTGIEQYLHIGYMAIVENSFRSDAFAEEFCQHEYKSTEALHSYYRLLMHIVGLIMANANDRNLVTTYCQGHNLLGSVCTVLKRSNSLLLTHDQLYKQLLIHCSGLVLLGARLKNREAQKTLEETMVHMVLQEHYYTGLLGIDLWSVFVRYHSTQLLFRYFEFWRKINDRFPLFRTRPHQIFVAQLLRNLWTFLPATQKAKLLDAHPASDKANDCLWLTVSLSGEIDDVRFKNFAETINKRLLHVMEMLQQKPTVESFYETLGLLLIANNMAHPSGAMVPKEAINRYWGSMLKWNIFWHTRAASSLLECFVKCIDRMPEPMLHSINSCVLYDADVNVKFFILKLLEKATPCDNIPSFIGQLLDDRCALITALAFHYICRFNPEQPNSSVQILFEQYPHIKSKLSALQHHNPSLEELKKWGECDPLPVPRCYQSGETIGAQCSGDMTQVDSKIDELLPDDDIEDDLLDLIGDNVSDAKKRRLDEPEAIFQCLSELEMQSKRLQNLLQSRELNEARKAQLQGIISTLTNVFDR